MGFFTLTLLGLKEGILEYLLCSSWVSLLLGIAFFPVSAMIVYDMELEKKSRRKT